ncbi:unnamed protein product [Calypogeia fissa]
MVNAKTRNQWKARLESTEALTSSARDGKGEAEVQQAPDTSGEVSKRKKSWSRKRKLGEVHEEQKSSGAELRADSNKGTMGSSNPRVPAQQMARKKVIYRAMERTRDVDDDAPAKTNINPNIPEKEAVVYSEKNGKRKVLGLKVRKHGKEKVGHVVSCHRRELNPNRKRRNLLNGLGEVSKDVVNLAGPRTRGMVKPGTGDQAGTARIKKRKQLRPEEKAAAPTIAEGELTGAEVSLFPVEETVKRPNVDLPINSSNLPSSNKTAAIAPLDIPTDISGLRNGPLQAEAKLSKPGRLRKNGKSISKVHLLKEKRDRLPKPVSPRVTRGMKGTATHVAGLEKSGSHPSKEDPKSGSNIHEPLAQPAVPTIAVETSSMQLRNHKKVREDPNSSGRPRKRVKKNQDKLPADTFQKGLDTVRASDPTSKGRTANGFESFGVIDAAISGGLVNHAETERNRNSSQNKEEDNGGVAHFSSTEARGSKMDSTSGIEPQVGHALLTPVQGLSVQCIEGGVETKTDKDRSRTNECTEGDVRKGTRLGRMKQREMKQIDPGGGDSVPNKKPSGSCRDVLQHEKTHKCKLTEESPQLRRGRSNNPQLGKQDAQNLEGMILEGTGRTQKPVELAEMRVKTPNEKSVQLERTDGRCQRIDHQHLASKTESWQGRSGKNRDYKGQEELSQASPVPKRRKTGSSRLVTPKSMVTEGKSKVVLKMAHSIKVTESFSGQGVDSNDVQSEGSGGQRSLLRDVVKVTPQASQVGLQAGDGNTPDQGEPCPCDSEGQQKHSVELCAPQECITCLPQMSISTIVTGDGRTFKETFDEVNLEESSCERGVTPEIVQSEQGEGRAEPLNEALEVTQTPSSVRAELVLDSNKKKIWRRRNYGLGIEFQRITRARDSKGKGVSDIESQGDKNVTVADAVRVEHVEINAEAVVSTTEESKRSPHLEQAAARKEDLERGKSLLHVSDLLYKCASSLKDDITGATIEHETEMKVIEAQKSLVPECTGADVFAVQEEENSAEPTSLPSSGLNPFEESKTAVQGELSGEQDDQPASSTVSLPYCEQRSINVPDFFSRLPDSPDGPFALEDKSLVPHSGEEKASNIDDGSLHLEVSHSPYFEKTCAQDSNRFGAAHGAYSVSTLDNSLSLATVKTSDPVASVDKSEDPVASIAESDLVGTIVESSPVAAPVESDPPTSIDDLDPAAAIVESDSVAPGVESDPVATSVESDPVLSTVASEPVGVMVDPDAGAIVVESEPMNTAEAVNPISTSDSSNVDKQNSFPTENNFNAFPAIGKSECVAVTDSGCVTTLVTRAVDALSIATVENSSVPTDTVNKEGTIRDLQLKCMACEIGSIRDFALGSIKPSGNCLIMEAVNSRQEQATLEAPLDDDFGLRDGNSIKSRLPEREGFQETSLGKVADKVEQEQPTPVEASVRQHTSDVKDSLTGTCASSEPCTQEKESTTEPEPSTSLLGGASVELVSSDCSQLELTDQMYTNESSDVAELTQFVADRTPQEGKVVPPLDHSLLGQKAERGVDLSGNGAQQSLYFGAGDLLVGIEQQVLKSCTGKSIAVHIKEGNITSPSRSSFDYVIVGNAPLEEKLASGFEDLHQPQSEVHERDEPIVRKVDVELEGRFEGHDETKKENSEVRKVDIEADGIHFEATEVHSETAEMLTDAIPVQSEAALVDLKAEGHDETKKQNEVREVDIEAEGIQFEAKEVHSKPSETEGARVPFEAAKVNLKADGHDEGKKEISEVREVDIEAGGIYFEAKEVHCKPSEMLTDAVRVQSEAEEVNLQAERHDEAKKENSEVREVNIAADGVRFEAKEVHSKRAEMLTDAVRVQSEAAEVNLKAEGHNETKNENSKVWEVHNEADCIDFEANEMQLETVEMVTDSVRVQSEAAEVKLKADGHDETKAQNLEVREVHIEADGIHFEAKEVQSEIVEMLTDAVRVQSEAAEVNRKAEGHDETKKENPEVREAHNEPEGILSEAKEVHSKTVEMLTDVVRVQSEAAEVNFNAEGLDETKQENSEVREVHYEPDGILFEAKEVHSKTVEMLTDAVRGQSEAMEVNLKAEELNLGVGTVQANVQEVQVDARLVDGAEELDDICVQAEVQEVQVDAQLVDGSEELDHICVQAKLREVQVEAQLVDGAEELDRMSLDGDAESVNAEPEGKQLDMETKEMYVGADDVHSELDWRTGVTEVDARPEVDPEGKDALADKVTNQRERTKERLVGMDNLDTTSTRQPLPSKNLVPGCDSFVSVAGQAMSVPEVDISRPLSTDGKLDQLTGPMTELMNSESVTLDIETHVQHDGQEICAQLNQQDTMLSGQLTSPLEASRCLEGEVLHPEDLSHFQVETQEKDDPKIQPLRVEDPVPQRNMAGVKANLVYKKRKVRSGIETPKEAEGGSRAEDVPSRVHSKKKGFLLASTSIESGGMRIRPRPLDPDQSIPILVEGRDKDFHEYDGGSFYRWVQQQEEAKLKKPTVDQPVADGVGESGGLSIVSRTDLVKKRPIFIPLFRKLPDKQTNSRIVVRPDQDVVLDMQSPLPTPQAYLRHMKPCARKLGHALGGSFCSVPSVYDMDDEDEEWLQACNEILKHSGAGQLLSEDTFEQLMELFEREFYRVCQINDSSLPVLSRSLVEKGGASGRRGKRLVMDSSHRYSRLEASKDGARFSSLSQQEIERRFAPQNRSEDCCICNGGENSDSNPVRRCQICSINVHESCYGICATESNDFRHHAENPNWRCRKCEAVVEGRALPSISCAICCKSGGAMKPTVDPLKWAHVACALYTNETFFIDTEAMEPVDGLAAVETRVKKQRERCGLCGAREGSCVRCSTRGCRTPFHISCGVSQGASFELRHTKQQVEGIRSFCPHHATFVPGTNIDESHHAPSKADDAGEPLPAVSTESSDTLELRHGEQQNMGDEGIGTEDAIMNGAGWQGSFSNTTKLHRSESRRYFRKIRSGERPRAICAGGIIPCNLDPISSPNEVSEKDSHGVSRTLPRSGSMVKEITMQSVLQYMDETDPYVHASDVERLESEAVSAATSASSSHLTTYENVDHTGKATSARDEGDPVNLAAKDKSVTGDAEISHAFSLKFPSLETLDTNLAPSPVVKAVYSFWQVKRVKSKGPILHELRQLQVARSHGIFNKIVHRSTDLLPPVVHDSPARMPVARRPRSLSRDPVFSKFSELRQQLEIVRSIASNGVRREQLKLEDQKLMYESVQQQLLIAREAPRSRRCLWCENTQNLLNCSSCPKAFCFQCFKHRRGYGVKGWIAASRLSEYVCNFCLGSSAQERGWPELSTTFSEPRGTPVSRVALVPGRVGDWNHGLEVRTKPNSGKQVSFLNETSNNPHGSSSSPQHGAAPMTQGRGKMIYTGRPIDALSVHSKFAVPCMNDRSRVVETAYHGGLASSGPNPAGNESRVQLDHPHGEGKKAKRRRVKEANKEAEPETVLRSTKRIKKLARSSSFVYGSEDETTVSESEETRFDKKTVRLSDLRDKEAESHFTNLLEVSAQDKAEKGHPPLKFGIKFSPTGTLIVRRHGPASQHP